MTVERVVLHEWLVFWHISMATEREADPRRRRFVGAKSEFESRRV
jgi:hypothetical protein